jgi:protoporphyrinogen oxidase
MTGISAAMELAKTGRFNVTLFEAADHLGGLSDHYTWDGITWDRFYHVVLSTDTETIGFIKDVGLADELFWRDTKSGFYGDGKLVSMSTPLDFIKFPFLSLWQKFRLGVGIIYSSRIKDPSRLDRIYAKQWLTRIFGRRVYEKVWDPLLRSKFGNAREKTSAAFIWATIKRLYGARSAENKQEQMGHVRGGYRRILEAAEKKLNELGVTIVINAKIVKIQKKQESGVRSQETEEGSSVFHSMLDVQFLSKDSKTQGLEGPKDNRKPSMYNKQHGNQTNETNQTLASEISSRKERSEFHRATHNTHSFDKALITVNCPAALNILGNPGGHRYWNYLREVKYLGVICMFIVLKHQLSPYYVINLLDKDLPFTGIIEVTNIVASEHFYGKHIVYLPKYVSMEDPIRKKTDQEIIAIFTTNLKKVFPALEDDSILHSTVFREDFVQPLQELNYLKKTCGFQTPLAGVYLANTSMINNSTLNNNAAITLAQKAVGSIIEN